MNLDDAPAIDLGMCQDLTGEVYGLLTAVKPVARSRYGLHWLCTCQCGQQVTRLGHYLQKQRVIGVDLSCAQCTRSRNRIVKSLQEPYVRKRHFTNSFVLRAGGIPCDTLLFEEAEMTNIRDEIASDLGFYPDEEVNLRGGAIEVSTAEVFGPTYGEERLVSIKRQHRAPPLRGTSKHDTRGTFTDNRPQKRRPAYRSKRVR